MTSDILTFIDQLEQLDEPLSPEQKERLLTWLHDLPLREHYSPRACMVREALIKANDDQLPNPFTDDESFAALTIALRYLCLNIRETDTDLWSVEDDLIKQCHAAMVKADHDTRVRTLYHVFDCICARLAATKRTSLTYCESMCMHMVLDDQYSNQELADLLYAIFRTGTVMECAIIPYINDPGVLDRLKDKCLSSKDNNFLKGLKKYVRRNEKEELDRRGQLLKVHE